MFTYENNYAGSALDTDRYLKDVQDCKDILDSFLVRGLQNLKKDGEYRVGDHVKGRMDLIAQELYGSFQYWWMLYAMNEVKSPEELKAGTLLKYATKQDLDNLVSTVVSFKGGVL